VRDPQDLIFKTPNRGPESWEQSLNGNRETGQKSHQKLTDPNCNFFTLYIVPFILQLPLLINWSAKPKSFPNQERLQKHKTTHVVVSCDECDKRFSARRNLRRHVKKKHEDDTLSDMVNRAEVVIQN